VPCDAGSGLAPLFLCGDDAFDDSPAVGGTGISGLPASAGVGEGVAVWIESAAHIDRFRPGQVLLAPYLDPGLSLVVENAAAAAFLYGGILSHGAIIAREYGVPAVVNVPRLREVPDGARVRVDGRTGAVVVIEPPNCR
jgi:pyruvate,water dikinase